MKYTLLSHYLLELLDYIIVTILDFLVISSKVEWQEQFSFSSELRQ